MRSYEDALLVKIAQLILENEELKMRVGNLLSQIEQAKETGEEQS